MVPAASLADRRAEDQLPVEKLNGGWVKYVDPESGHPYYYHEESDESTYDRPKGFETVANPFASVRSSTDVGTAAKMSARRDDEQLPVEKLNGGWEKFVDPDSGYPYYFNENTGESTFERPSGFATLANPFASTRSTRSAASVAAPPPVAAGVLSVRRRGSEAVEKLNGGWQKFVDPESGHPYFYHEESDESTYDRPSGFATVADPFGSAREGQGAVPLRPFRRGS